MFIIYISMDFDTDFKKRLEASLVAKELAPSSIRLYLRNLEKLNNNQPLKNLNFLKDTSAINERLTKYAENTIRAYLISICSVLALDKSTKPKQKLYDSYFELMMDKNKQLKAVEASGEKTATQSKNWIEWSEVEAKYGELENKVNAFKNNKTLTESQYNVLLQYVILSLYVLLPPRRNEYQNMILSKKVTENSSPDVNYLDLEKKQFVFNKFKTSKKEGSVVIDLPEQFLPILYIYLKHHPLIQKNKISKKIMTPFLVNYDGSPFIAINSITRVLNRIFGKNVGSSMLRHIYLSSKYGDVKNEQAKDAVAMSHTTGMQKDYIKQ